jgi:hypothetical protein
MIAIFSTSYLLAHTKIRNLSYSPKVLADLPVSALTSHFHALTFAIEGH